jgi:hypothetical protein
MGILLPVRGKLPTHAHLLLHNGERRYCHGLSLAFVMRMSNVAACLLDTCVREIGSSPGVSCGLPWRLSCPRHHGGMHTPCKCKHGHAHEFTGTENSLWLMESFALGCRGGRLICTNTAGAICIAGDDKVIVLRAHALQPLPRLSAETVAAHNLADVLELPVSPGADHRNSVREAQKLIEAYRAGCKADVATISEALPCQERAMSHKPSCVSDKNVEAAAACAWGLAQDDADEPPVVCRQACSQCTCTWLCVCQLYTTRMFARVDLGMAVPI